MKTIVSLMVGALTAISSMAQMRQITSFNEDWKFYDAYNFERSAPKKSVTLPHSWNVEEIAQSVMEYRRTAGFYEKFYTPPADWKSKRLFLRFEGVNSVADVWINNRLVTRHKGGYTAFAIELNPWLKDGENRVLVMASNAFRTDVLPLHGDFNIYGGIHRPVSLIITDKNCITPLDYGAGGVYISQPQVSKTMARVVVNSNFLLQKNAAGLMVHTTIADAEGRAVQQVKTPLAAGKNTLNQTLTILKPRLWNGKADPYLYRVKVALLQNNRIIDAVEEPLGLRYFSIDAQKGFYLNGEYLNLYGFGKHDDWEGKGTMATHADYEKDMALVNEIGATSLRLTHYPHNHYFYELADKSGIILWTEIPLIGPGGYTGTGYVNDKALHESITQNTLEMVKQHFNNPSVVMWGLGNELLLNYDDPQPFLKELNKKVKALDPGRLTTYASNLGFNEFSTVTDLLAWNKYYGWYGESFDYIGRWADDAHRHLPNKPIAVSEYGAGASPYKHLDSLVKTVPNSKFHPEEWATAFHEYHWRELKARPFLWGKYIWVFADFSSSIRTEGDKNGINDKGLITYDRQLKKDAFFFYKANWNPAPMVFIAERRHQKRKGASQAVKVYANVPVELFVNGASLGIRQPNDIKIAQWDKVIMNRGENQIMVRNTQHNLQDEVIRIIE